MRMVVFRITNINVLNADGCNSLYRRGCGHFYYETQMSVAGYRADGLSRTELRLLRRKKSPMGVRSMSPGEMEPKDRKSVV